MFLAQIPFMNNLSPQAQETLVRVALAAIALVIIWLLRRFVAWLLIRPLRLLTQRTSSTTDDTLIEAMVVPARVLVMALGVHVSIRILTNDPSVLNFTQNLTRTLVVIAIFTFMTSLVDILAPSSPRFFSATGITVEERLLPFARTAIKLILAAITIVIVVQEWGYDVSGLIAGLGIGGLAVSLAAQDTIANLFGFSAIVGDSPFHVGEEIKALDIEGTVERVGIRSTRIRQRDQALVTVPNGRLAQNPVLNWSRLNKRYYDATIGIGYEANSMQLRQLIERIREILASREKVDKDSIAVHFFEFRESSFKIQIRVYLYLPVLPEFTAEKERINFAIMEAVADLGLTLK